MSGIRTGLICLLASSVGWGQPLALVENGKPVACICVSSKAGKWEKQAADDLATGVLKMTGAALPVRDAPPAEGENAIVIGQLALPYLESRLMAARKARPVLRGDSIALWSQPHRLYVGGSNDDSHYFAVAELMRRWGCRWYFPTEFGECLPRMATLTQEPLDYKFAPVFEVRSYWLSWNGDRAGYDSFLHRNFMNGERVPCGHGLGKYAKTVRAQLGKFEVTDPQAANLVAQQAEADFGQGRSLSLSIEDATVTGMTESDRLCDGNFRDKYFGVETVSDSYLQFYNRVCEALLAKHPDNEAKIGFLAYINLTMAPQRQVRAAAPLICYLAGIDADPNHSDSPSKLDYFGTVRRWVEVMQGRVVIYDYDQGMLVWRDLPDPSQHVFAQDVKKYRQLGVLGIDTESRGAIATTFLNLYFRGQLMWNPDLDVDAELDDFYRRFFGPLSGPMKMYWNTIFERWKATPVMEHEFFVIPYIYDLELVQKLRQCLTEAGRIRVEEPYATRLRFIQLSFSLIEGYVQQLASISRADYAGAVAAGRKALAEREKLTDLSATFTTYRKMPEKGPAFWPGEVDYLQSLQELVDGTRGKLVKLSPEMWDFRCDPHDHGIWQGWGSDLATWSKMSVDRYLLPQGSEPEEGFAWYRWRFSLTAPEARGPLHLMMPGLFNESWLYVNGHFVEHRPQKGLWWLDDYRFQWDASLGEGLHEGENWVTVRCKVPLHFAGMFRRPFLYRVR